jgi:hypothetical protein
MGNQDLAVCQRHMAKLSSHIANASPTVADGKPPTAATGTVKAEFTVCHFRCIWQTTLSCVFSGARQKKVSRRVAFS